MKLLRTIRLDPSDTFVFEQAAEPGEWAVPGSFAFMNEDPDKLQGKARVAFRSGFLGIDSFGWSTLAQIVEATNADRAAAVGLLAQRLMTKFGAPDMAAAGALTGTVTLPDPHSPVAIPAHLHIDGIEIAMNIVPQGQPLNPPDFDSITLRRRFSTARFELPLGTGNSGKWLHISSRWINSHYPDLSGHWGPMATILIP